MNMRTKKEEGGECECEILQAVCQQYYYTQMYKFLWQNVVNCSVNLIEIINHF